MFENDALPEFNEGDVLEIKGHRFRIRQVDLRTDGSILQYRLDRMDEDGPTANIGPLHHEGTWGVSFHYEEPRDEIELVEEDDSDV